MRLLFAALLFVVGMLMLFGPIASLEGQTVEELKGKIEDRQTNIQVLEEEIRQYEEQIQETRAEAESLDSAIKEINITRNKIQADINLTESKITRASTNIANLGEEIAVLDTLANKNRLAIAKSLRDMREVESNTLVEVIFSSENISSLWGTLNNHETLQRGLNSRLDDLRSQKRVLDATRSQEETEKNNLNEFKGELSDKKYLADRNKNEKAALLAETENKEANYQKILEEKKKLRDAFEAEIREIESQLRVVIDPASLPPPGSAPLDWPVESVYITQRFGRTVDAQRLYVSGTHNGIDLGVSTGSDIIAPHGGVVTAIGDTDQTCPGASYGKWVLMDHRNGLSSLFAHLSLAKTSVGAELRRGDLVGYSGNTGYSTGPHLHYTVFATQGIEVKTRASRVCSGREYRVPLAPSNAYLDPLLYLPLL